jgi:CHAT domain-containing protein
MSAPVRKLRVAWSFIFLLGLLRVATIATSAQTLNFVAPPRTIADIITILDGERPNNEQITATQTLALALAPEQLAGEELALFYFRRAIARWDLGRAKDAIADCEEAVRLARASSLDPYNYQTLLLRLLSNSGAPQAMLQVLDDMLRENDGPEKRWRRVAVFRWRVIYSLAVGRIVEAEANLRNAESIVAEAKTNSIPLGITTNWVLEEARARILAWRGDYAAAESSFRQARAYNRTTIREQAAQSAHYSLRNSQEMNADLLIDREARMKMLQGRVVEAEADMRRALLSRLRMVGKYSSELPFFILALADVLAAQERIAEAEKLIRTSLEIYRTMGVSQDTTRYLGAQKKLATIFGLEGHWSDVARIYDDIDAITASWPPQLRSLYRLSTDHVNALYEAGRTSDGIKLARELLDQEQGRVGYGHVVTAMARGYLAIGLSSGGDSMEALRQFREAIPILRSRLPESSGEDDTVGSAVANRSRQAIVETYISLLTREPRESDGDDGSFGLADLVRGSTVQNALMASNARAAAGDPVLAELARKEQNLAKQIGAQFGFLNNLLGMPVAARDDKAVDELRDHINSLRAEHEAVWNQIERLFPSYSELLAPTSPDIAQIRNVLKREEAFISFFFGRKSSFVWAVPKKGPVAFAAIPFSAAELEAKVTKLRKALEPDAAMISDIPPFDLKAAYDLYSRLLKPVEAGWKQAKSLIVVTNGALGLLPLSLLPTAPVEAQNDNGLPFSGYRNVPWLARTHAVTLVPSAAALRTLRKLPSSLLARDPFIGFGDPYFSVEEAAEAAAEQRAKPVQVASADTATTAMRGLPLKRRSSPHTEGVSSAELAQLPRLPDTAAELTSIAKALGLDPAKVLHLGKDANEQAVETADLTHYRIIDFATHGLVPGELNGLTQPALALTAPQVAGVPGDGLLTMEKILALKLNADWVVLSACNTAAGAGAGAEAASGLGQAFFYAGTRSILVTNWSVHSQSARELVADLFRRQTTDAKLSRGEALRQASMALMDGNGFTGEKGETVFSYAHPLFWAPYTIIGDGGGANP